MQNFVTKFAFDANSVGFLFAILHRINVLMQATLFANAL